MPPRNVFEEEELRAGHLDLDAVDERLRRDDVRQAHRASRRGPRFAGPVVQFSTTGSLPARCSPRNARSHATDAGQHQADVRGGDARGTARPSPHAPMSELLVGHAAGQVVGDDQHLRGARTPGSGTPRRPFRRGSSAGSSVGAAGRTSRPAAAWAAPSPASPPRAPRVRRASSAPSSPLKPNRCSTRERHLHRVEAVHAELHEASSRRGSRSSASGRLIFSSTIWATAYFVSGFTSTRSNFAGRRRRRELVRSAGRTGSGAARTSASRAACRRCTTLRASG